MNIQKFNWWFKKQKYNGSPYQAESITYFNAIDSVGGSLTDYEKYAINDHISNLKTEGLWSKISVLYIMRGQSREQNAINVKSPGTYDATFNGSGEIHYGFGISAGSYYIDTGFNPKTHLNPNSVHMGYYCNNEVNFNMGAQETGNHFRLLPKWSGATSHLFDAGSNAGTVTATLDPYGSCSLMISRNNSSNHQVYQNDAKVAEVTTASTALPDGNIYINAVRVVGGTYIGSLTNALFCYAHIGTGLTEEESITLQKLKNKLQTYFAVNVYDSEPVNDSFYITSHTYSLSVNTASGDINYVKNGTPGTQAYSVELPSVTATYGRYDLIQIDPDTLSVSQVNGTERQVNMYDYLPAATYYPFLSIYTDTSGTKFSYPLYTYRINELVKSYNRDYLLSIRTKLASSSVKIAAIGDSITAISTASPQSDSVPNSPNRDLLSYLQNMPNDTRTELFGTTSDTASASIGFVKRLTDYLNTTYSNNVTYSNFGKNGNGIVAMINRASFVSDDNPDVIFINTGMNDVFATINTNLPTLIDYFLTNSPNAKIIVTSEVRTYNASGADLNVRRAHQTKCWIHSTWAIKKGVAFFDALNLYDKEYFRATGLSPLHYCNGNTNNHPGYYELNEYYKVIKELFV